MICNSTIRAGSGQSGGWNSDHCEMFVVRNASGSMLQDRAESHFALVGAPTLGDLGGQSGSNFVTDHQRVIEIRG